MYDHEIGHAEGANMIPAPETGRNGRRLKASPSEISALKAKNYSQRQIAKILGVSPSYITWIAREYGGVVPSPRDTKNEMWPWAVPSEFRTAAPALRLRDHLDVASGGGKNLSPKRRALLRGFYKRLLENNEVVEFDPTIPPHEGVFTGGWAYRPRTEADGELLIRVNEYTKPLTERMKLIWRFPPRTPE